jgi:hypothetical protein
MAIFLHVENDCNKINNHFKLLFIEYVYEGTVGGGVRTQKRYVFSDWLLSVPGLRRIVKKNDKNRRYSNTGQE